MALLSSKLSTVHKGFALVVVLLCLVTGGKLAIGSARSGAQSGVGQAVPVEPVKVQARQGKSRLVLSAQLEPVQVSTLSAQVSATVRARARELGQAVAVHQPVVLLDDSLIAAQIKRAEAAAAQAGATYAQAQTELQRLQVEVAQAQTQSSARVVEATAALQKSRTGPRAQEVTALEAQLGAARAEEAQAKQEWERSRQLLREGAIASQSEERQRTAWHVAQARMVAAEQSLSAAREGDRTEDRSAAQAQLQQAQASLEVAEAGPLRLQAMESQLEGLAAQARLQGHTVEESRVLLERHVLRAPYSGRVLTLYVQAGDLVQPGTPVARVGKIDQLKVKLSVPEQARRGLAEGQTLKLVIDEIETSATLVRLGLEADATTHTFPVELLVDNADERFLPNMLARVELPSGGEEERLVLPLSCLSSDGAGHFVYVVDGGKASRRDVQLGEPDGDGVEVVAGLKGTETVAAHPQRLLEGSPVSIR